MDFHFQIFKCGTSLSIMYKNPAFQGLTVFSFMLMWCGQNFRYWKVFWEREGDSATLTFKKMAKGKDCGWKSRGWMLRGPLVRIDE